MRKKIIWLLVAAMSLSLSGCGKKDKDASTKSDTEQTISLSDFSSDYGDVELCDYNALTGVKNIYPVTDEAVDSEIEYSLYDYTDYIEVDRASVTGDYVDIKLKATVNGNTVYDYTDEEGYSLCVGYEEFGKEFDDKLTGVVAGDKLDFTITFDDDYYDEELAGSDVDFSVEVVTVTEEKTPELTDAFVSENLGYDSIADMKESLRESLEATNEETSESELRENLIQQIITNSTYSNYPQELYDSCAATIKESYEGYVEMFGASSVEEIYEMFGMTDEDIEKEILNQVYRMMTIFAIAEAQELTVNDEEYNDYLELFTAQAEVTDSEELISTYGEDSINFWIIESKVLDYIESNAKITETISTATDALETEEIDE